MAFTSASSGFLVGWEGAKLTGAKYKRTSIYDATLKITIQYPLSNGKFGKHILDGTIDFIDGIFYCEDAYGQLYEFEVSNVNYVYPPVPESPIGKTFTMDYQRDGEPLISIYVYSAKKSILHNMRQYLRGQIHLQKALGIHGNILRHIQSRLKDKESLKRHNCPRFRRRVFRRVLQYDNRRIRLFGMHTYRIKPQRMNFERGRSFPPLFFRFAEKKFSLALKQVFYRNNTFN